MNKRLHTFVLIVLSLILLACAKGGQGGTGEANTLQAAVTARLLTGPVGIDDRSFNAGAWLGMKDFYGNGNDSAFSWVAAPGMDHFLPALKQASDDGFGLIVVSGFSWARALSQAAAEYPEQNYLIVDAGRMSLPNVLQAVFLEHEGSFLAGAAAAMKAKADGVIDPAFGFIGGIADPTITKFELGWVQGIRFVLPDARIVDYYTGDWNRPDLAKAQAKLWFDTGVYAVFSAAGASGLGSIAQAREYRLAGKNVWAVGVDGDQYEDGLYADNASAVLTSMVKRVDKAVFDALEALANGNFHGGTRVYGLAEGGLSLSERNSALDDGIRSDLKVLASQIASGVIVVHPSYAQALAAGKAPEGLKAVDQ